MLAAALGLALLVLAPASRAQECSVSAYGGSTSVTDGETLYFAASDTSSFSRTFVISDCPVDYTDTAPATLIATDTVSVTLQDPTGDNQYYCTAADDTLALPAFDGAFAAQTFTFTCPVQVGSMAEGTWYLFTQDTGAVLDDFATFDVTHEEISTTVTATSTVVVLKATQKVTLIEFPDACCPNTVLRRTLEERNDVPTVTATVLATKTVKSGTSYQPFATVSPVLVCPRYGGSLLASWIKTELNIYKALHGGSILVSCKGTQVYY
ncbi:hypothetical protein Q5752_001881 [Cryptotrichosporon argae]